MVWLVTSALSPVCARNAKVIRPFRRVKSIDAAVPQTNAAFFGPSVASAAHCAKVPE
jgi:hypothetical protein